MTPSLKGLKAVEAALRLGSFVAAADELNVTQTAISRLVKLVEGQIGQTLFERHANSLVPTPAGRSLAPLLDDAFRRLEAAVDSVRRTTLPGLSIAAGPTFAMRWLIPRLQHFQRQHPGIEVRLVTAIDDHVALRPDWAATIRLSSAPLPGLMAEPLFSAALFPVAAPALAETIRKRSDLQHHTLLEVAHAPKEWPRWLAESGLDPARFRRRLSFDYSTYAIQAALDGLGIALVRAPYVQDDLDAGRLIRLFDLALVDPGRAWHLIYRAEALQDAPFVAFRAWLLAEVQRSARSEGRQDG
ncbi:LysR substrate-binding domain-containing protein [Dongia sp.]|uniref:LysR substrate-binding domain-containing protein n=1 Tax=Dongia sp. TaxID=1977262 RepID=UPI0035B09CB3